MPSTDALLYEPQPFGLPDARRAVACDYARRGFDVTPDRIVLTASTSEAYSLLFKLLCEPSGSAVMVPVPSYPLFDHLTALDGVQPIPYRLDYHGRWTIAIDELERRGRRPSGPCWPSARTTPPARCCRQPRLQALSTFCAERQAALIVDEVFADYPLTPEAGSTTATEATAGAHVPARRIVEVRGPAAGQAGMDAVDGPDQLVAKRWSGSR